jgi:phosphatidylserine/phosphatidylglycerophosphate/cardiolipin synthase-like enzyme
MQNPLFVHGRGAGLCFRLVVAALALFGAACVEEAGADDVPGAGAGGGGEAGVPWASGMSRHAATAADGAAALYFTNPGVARGDEEDPVADDAIVALIEGATTSVDLCLYEFDRHTLVEAAVAAAGRGVRVRFAGDGDELGDDGYQALIAAGVELVLRPANDRIMHNKFVVVDGRWVVTGSMNFSENGVMLNNNNVVTVESEALAARYTAEFEQMYAGGLFGRSKAPIAGETSFEVGGREIEAFFSPEDGVDQRVRDVLLEADHSVLFMVFSFTDTDIAGDLIALHQAGLEVAGVFDESQARGRYSVDELMAQAGVPVLIDGNLNAIGFAGGKLHHKVLIVDAGTDSDPTVITGSFNWSRSATDYNDENVLILHGADFVAPFLEEFCRVYEVGTVHPELVAELADPCANLLTPVRINELMANPDGTDTNEEWVELVNTGSAAISLAGWRLGDALDGERHVFGELTLSPGGSVVVYSGPNAGEPDRLVATSGALSLNNNTDIVTLRDAAGVVIDQVEYASPGNGVSFNRSPDGAADGPFVTHEVLTPGVSASPGLRADGSDWAPPPGPRVMINELMANPVGTDRNNEFVEITNAGTVPATLSGWTLSDASGLRHTFAEDTVLSPGHALVLFDGGTHERVPNVVIATSGSLSLNNPGDTVTLRDAAGEVVDEVVYPEAREGVSFNRSPDATPGAELVLHDALGEGAAAESPGLRADGSLWETDLLPVLLINEVMPNPEGTDDGNEFVEIVNIGPTPVDLDRWRLGDAVSAERHIFATRVLGIGEAVVVYDGGEHPGVPGAVLATAGTLSLNNTSEIVELRDPSGAIVDAVHYAAVTEGVSLNRAVDGQGGSELVDHDTLEGAVGPSSPGLRAGGTDW